MAWPLALLAALAVVTGFIALPIGYEGIGTFLVAPGHEGHAFEVVPVWLLASIVLALGGLALAYVAVRKGRHVHGWTRSVSGTPAYTT